MTLSNQFLLQGQIVFNNTVMYHNEFAAAIHMGMRITIGRTAMSCPTGVTNAHGAHRHIARQFCTQCIQAAHALIHTNSALFHHRDASRVIAAILQFAHAVQQKGSSLIATNVTNDTTHNSILLYFICYSATKAFSPLLPMGFVFSLRPTAGREASAD